MHIRTAIVEDAERLAKLAARLFEESYGGQFSEGDMQEHVEQSFSEGLQRQEILDPDMFTFLVDGAEGPVGYAQLRRKPNPLVHGDPHDLELQRIYLDGSLHGRGVAGKLLDELKEVAKNERAKSIWLSVWEKNPRAIAFYEKHDFETVGKHPFMVGQDEQWDLIMVWHVVP